MSLSHSLVAYMSILTLHLNCKHYFLIKKKNLGRKGRPEWLPYLDVTIVAPYPLGLEGTGEPQLLSQPHESTSGPEWQTLLVIRASFTSISIINLTLLTQDERYSYDPYIFFLCLSMGKSLQQGGNLSYNLTAHHLIFYAKYITISV